jgi:hypothetical protein
MPSQAMLQMVVLCFLLVLVDSSQTAAIPYTGGTVCFWFVNYIKNLQLKDHASWCDHYILYLVD